MQKRSLVVENELGLHARVAGRIVRELKNFSSKIVVQKNDQMFDLKNVTGVITVNAKHGDVLDLEISGEDEEKAAAAIEQLFANKFGER